MKKVLVIDDTRTNIDILVELLSQKYDVVVSLSGSIALEILEKESIDLILLDVMMPDMDGFEVCKHIKANNNTRDIPIIFITAKTDEESIEQGYLIGGSDYVTKPFKPRELLSKLSREFKLQDTIRELRYVSSHDTMTGILNRKSFFEKGTNVFDKNTETSYAVMIDIDHFKKINDTYGHFVGDEVIRSITQTIKMQLSDQAIFGRLGGEEFAIILELPVFEDIEQKMNSIRKVIETTQINITSNEFINVTISQGIAKKTNETKDIDSLLKKADEALYEAKREGRNKVVYKR